MKTLTEKCTHHPWRTQFWLLLAVLSNSNGSIIFFTTFLQNPFSYISSVIYIICYRLYFDIKSDQMPIAIDLCFSLLSQTIVEYKSWEFALSFSFFLNMVVFKFFIFVPHLWAEYVRVNKEEVISLKKKTPTMEEIIHPLSFEVFHMAVIGLYVFQVGLFVLMVFFPFGGEEIYGFYQMVVGYFLVDQSMAFLSCYDDMIRNRVSR